MIRYFKNGVLAGFLIKNQMRNLFTVLALFTLFGAIAQPKTPTSARLKLSLQSEDGTNGCAVVWNPKLRLYYSVIAGNASFPIDIFDESGKWKNVTNAGIDNRGMWFNAKSGRLNGHSYQGEIIEWELSGNGTPENTSILVETGPEGQSVATSGKGLIYLYKEGVIEKYSAKGKKSGAINLSDFNAEKYNAYSMGFTGVKGYEIVLLNLENTALDFFNLKGKRTASINLPGEVPYAENFRFSFANNYAWLYDVDTRTWSGYKVF
jgi:hypothetical protein